MTAQIIKFISREQRRRNTLRLLLIDTAEILLELEVIEIQVAICDRAARMAASYSRLSDTAPLQNLEQVLASLSDLLQGLVCKCPMSAGAVEGQIDAIREVLTLSPRSGLVPCLTAD